MSERYCQSCGEDAWEFETCIVCGTEFCSDCASVGCFMLLKCPKCREEEESKTCKQSSSTSVKPAK